MFAQLTEKIRQTIHQVSGHGKLKELDVDQFVRELRMNLLSADVHYQVTKEFAQNLKEKAMGQQVLKSFKPAELFQKLVYEEITGFLGGVEQTPPLLGQKPHVVFLVGLTGSGKTTTLAKLARFWRSKGHQPLMVSTDVRRPAAMEQLKVLGDSLSIPVYPAEIKQKPKNILKEAKKTAQKNGHSILLVDTAGRLHVEEDLMKQLADLTSRVKDPLILYALDAAVGQDAVKSVTAFHQDLNLTGTILTKIDSDARGGAALSVSSVTKLPIFFAGSGEKMEDFEVFVPDRFASRIMGMGDVASLAEKVGEAIDEEQAKRAAEKLKKGSFNLEDMREQMKQASKMGGLQSLMGYLPGMSALKNVDTDKMDRELKHKEAILNSMTQKERGSPKILNGSRRRRIALGSGVSVAQVNRLLKEYEMMKKMFKKGGMMKNMRHLLG